MNKWYSALDEPPRPCETVLTFTRDGQYRVNYMNSNGLWHDFGDMTEYWMPLPRPPADGAALRSVNEPEFRIRRRKLNEV